MSKRSIGYIKKVSDGKYQLRLSCGFDDFGKRIQPSKTVSCSSDREAERLLHEFSREWQNSRVFQSENAPKTLFGLYDAWMENHVKLNLAPRTVRFYSDLWKCHLAPHGGLKLKSANPKNINSILSTITQGRTKNGAYKMLKTMFNKAVKWGYMQNNPCDMINTPKYKAKEKKTLTESQIRTVMSVLPGEELKYQAIFYFAAMCGMRRQEIRDLKWGDFNLEDSSFRVERVHKSDKAYRKLYLPSGLDRILSQLRKEQITNRMQCGDKWIEGDYLFTQWNGLPMDINTPTKWWAEFSQRNGIHDVTLHGLRHTAATFMIKSNVPISTVSGILGHAQISTTLNIYTHVIEDTKKAAIDTLANIFQPKSEIGAG